MTKHRKLKIALLTALVLLLGMCTIGSRRHGLLNNAYGDQAALVEHDAAWQQRRYGNEISRLTMEMLVRVYDGHCITQDAEWETVPMDRRLDDFLRPNNVINCYFDVGSWLPPARYRWDISVQPTTRDRLRVVRAIRHRDMAFP